MASQSSAPRIMNRASRAKLPVRRDPYWHLIAEGQHLGYRKGKKGGTWIARYYRPGKGRSFESIGQADDTVDPDGYQVLSFTQAVEAAQKFMASVSRSDNAGIRVGKYTVEDAAQDWLKVFTGSDRSKQTSNGNIRNYILPPLGTLEVEKLTRRQVQAWLHTTAETPTVRSLRVNSKKSCDLGDPETQRKRRESANRVLNDLKALLTLAYRNQHTSSKAAWETVQPIPNTSTSRKATLEVEEAIRLIDACGPDFAKMVQAALITGCRWGELCRLEVQDFDQRAGLLRALQEKTGNVKHIALTEEDVRFFEINALGKSPSAILFTKADGTAWSKSDQQGRMRTAVKAAKVKDQVTFHALRHTVGRWLAERNLPMAIIAKHLGHSNSRVTEQFYAHYSPSHVQDTIRASKPSLTLVPGGRAPNAG